MIFLGTYNHTVDTKNRLTLPSKFIEKLSNEIFISKGFDGCLEIRTEKEYKEYVDQLLTHPNTGSNARQVQRVFLGNSYKVEIDSTKRVLIPANLKEKANIDKDVFIIGVGSRIEIWDKDTYAKYANEAESKYESAAEALSNENK